MPPIPCFQHGFFSTIWTGKPTRGKNRQRNIQFVAAEDFFDVSVLGTTPVQKRLNKTKGTAQTGRNDEIQHYRDHHTPEDPPATDDPLGVAKPDAVCHIAQKTQETQRRCYDQKRGKPESPDNGF
jgi:hypothetical protein